MVKLKGGREKSSERNQTKRKLERDCWGYRIAKRENLERKF